MRGYLQLYAEGRLQKRTKRLHQALSSCTLCPHTCRVNRLAGEQGYCGTGEQALVSSCGPHYGEESPLVGPGGSGTIFFAHCNLKCIYCQNYDISILGRGQEVSAQELGQMMLSLQKRGCSNINLVTPSHVVPQILAGLLVAIEGGLNLPLVYNSGGYEQVSLLVELSRVIDIYMPDLKYLQEEKALQYSGVRDYPSVVQESLREMHSQVGELRIQNGLAVAGLIIRHLILPGNLTNTRLILEFIAGELSPNTYLNLMDQYYPAYKAHEVKELKYPLSVKEYQQAVRWAERLGLHRLAP